MISKREWLINKDMNATKQKEQSEMVRLKKLQKPTGQQVDERFENRMTSAVPATVQSILKDTLNPEAFKKNDSEKY